LLGDKTHVGLVAAPGLVLVGQLHMNPDLQAIGWALLLAGGVSLLCDGLKQTRDLDTELGSWLLLHMFNMCGVIFARFYVFPQAAYNLMNTVILHHPKWLAWVSGLGIGSMTLFNCIVFAILTEKLMRNGLTYIKRKFATTSAIKED